MADIESIISDIYDPKIEEPEYQALMGSCIRAWLRDAIARGIILGREELAVELEKTIKKSLNPGAHIVVMGG